MKSFALAVIFTMCVAAFALAQQIPAIVTKIDGNKLTYSTVKDAKPNAKKTDKEITKEFALDVTVAWAEYAETGTFKVVLLHYNSISVMKKNSERPRMPPQPVPFCSLAASNLSGAVYAVSIGQGRRST